MAHLALSFLSHVLGERHTVNLTLLSFKDLVAVIFEILVQHVLHLIDVLGRIMNKKLKIQTATDINFEVFQVCVLVERADGRIQVIHCGHVRVVNQKHVFILFLFLLINMFE